MCFFIRFNFLKKKEQVSFKKRTNILSKKSNLVFGKIAIITSKLINFENIYYIKIRRLLKTIIKKRKKKKSYKI